VLNIRKDEFVKGNQAGGGGYGNPLERDPKRVLIDVIERYETLQRANDIYGVVLSGTDPDTMRVDEAATARRRAELSPAS